MKERLKRVFGVFGRFFGKLGVVIVAVVVIAFVVGWLVGWPVATAYLARDSGFYHGWVYHLTSENTKLEKALDAAAVEEGRLTYERDSYKEAAEQLQVYVQQLQQTTMPIGQVLWCTNMSTDLIAQDKKSLVLATAKFVAELSDVDVAPVGVCVDIVGIASSELRGEMYVPALRVFPGGTPDPLLVYWQAIPGEEGKARIIGYYSWITREWHPVGP